MTNFEQFRKIEELGGYFTKRSGAVPFFDDETNLHVAQIDISGNIDSTFKFYIEDFYDEQGVLVAASRRTTTSGVDIGYLFVSNEEGTLLATTIDKDKNLVATEIGSALTSLCSFIDDELKTF